MAAASRVLTQDLRLSSVGPGRAVRPINCVQPHSMGAISRSLHIMTPLQR